MPHPAKVFVFIEVDPVSICWSEFEIPARFAATSKHASGAFHGKGSVLAYGDGHAEHHKWQRPSLGLQPNEAAKPDPHPVSLNRDDANWIRVRSHHTAGDF